MTNQQTSDWISIGVDTGGTFTDFVLSIGNRIYTHKLLSTPSNPAEAVLQGLEEVVSQIETMGSASLVAKAHLTVTHGSTVATNTLLERNGAEVALLTTKNFEDLLQIGRQNRAELYNFNLVQPVPLVDESKRYGIKERICHTGEVQVPLDPTELDQLINQLPSIEAIAVCFLFSYINPKHERMVAEALVKRAVNRSIPISTSHQILPEYREFERFSTTVANAYVQPKVQKYLHFLHTNLATRLNRSLASKPRLRIMQSNGGSISVETASRVPIRTALSGPAGGVIGAYEIGKTAKYEQLITFDMGGTSTDVSLCDREISLTTESQIGGIPIQIPMIDIHTVGAGGGSVAQVDLGGALRVGPESAGADPGPACYGVGDLPTVTDANLFLGRIDPRYFLGGKMSLQPERSTKVIHQLSTEVGKSPLETAEGILRVANATMARAIRVVSIERGYDPREFALISFGGAGGLHACELAQSLSIPTVIIPPHGGLLSAMGMLLADVVKDYSQTVLWQANEHLYVQLTNQFRSLRQKAENELGNEGFEPELTQYQLTLDLRYSGQSYELNVPFDEQFETYFHQAHAKRFGHSRTDYPVEVVNLRLRAIGYVEKPKFASTSEKIGATSDISAQPFEQKEVVFGEPRLTNLYHRQDLSVGVVIASPSIIFELSATTVVPPDFKAKVDQFDNLILSQSESF